MVLIFPYTYVAVSLQAPDGDYAINAAFALLKGINQKDLFVPTCWLWDIPKKKKKLLAKCRDRVVHRIAGWCSDYGKLLLGPQKEKREEAVEKKHRKRVRNKLWKKGEWVARCQLVKQWNDRSSHSFLHHLELFKLSAKTWQLHRSRSSRPGFDESSRVAWEQLWVLMPNISLRMYVFMSLTCIA